MIRFRRPVRRATCRLLGLSTRPFVDPGTAYVCDYIADWYRAHPSEQTLKTTEEWEYWGMLSPEVGEEIVRAARRWPLLYRAVRSEVGAAVSKAAEREPTAH